MECRYLSKEFWDLAELVFTLLIVSFGTFFYKILQEEGERLGEEHREKKHLRSSNRRASWEREVREEREYDAWLNTSRSFRLQSLNRLISQDREARESEEYEEWFDTPRRIWENKAIRDWKHFVDTNFTKYLTDPSDMGKSVVFHSEGDFDKAVMNCLIYIFKGSIKPDIFTQLREWMILTGVGVKELCMVARVRDNIVCQQFSEPEKLSIRRRMKKFLRGDRSSNKERRHYLSTLKSLVKITLDEIQHGSIIKRIRFYDLLQSRA